MQFTYVVTEKTTKECIAYLWVKLIGGQYLAVSISIRVCEY